MSLSSDEHLYLFANWFLWAVFPILMYLNEKGALEGANPSMQWVDACEVLADWAANESAYTKHTRATQEERNIIYPKGVELVGSLTERLGDELLRGSFTDYKQYPIINEAIWLHHHYCSFLLAVLKEYDQLIQGLGAQNELYQRYQENIGLFNNVINACQIERASLERPSNMNPETIDKLLADMDAFAARLGIEWREAVLYAVQNI